MVDFGAGILLDENLDFRIDTTGDIGAERGVDELQKDLAFQMIINLQRYLGQPPSGNIGAKVADTARRVALADERVRSVASGSLEVTFSEDREQINVAMVVRTTSGSQELVFNV